MPSVFQDDVRICALLDLLLSSRPPGDSWDWESFKEFACSVVLADCLANCQKLESVSAEAHEESLHAYSKTSVRWWAQDRGLNHGES